MVSLAVRPPPRAPRAGRDGTRALSTQWLVGTGAVAAILAAAVAMAVLSAITVLLWAAGPLATDGLSAAPFRGAASLWLMGQRAPLDSGTYDLVLPPLAVTVVVAFLIARLAGWAARATSAFELAPAAIVVGGVVAGHVVVSGVAGWVSAQAGSGVDTLDAMRAGLVFALLCAVAGIAPHTWPWATVAARIGPRVRIGARAAGRGVIALLAGGAVALLISLGMHSGDVLELGQAVGGGISGAVGTTLLCLALAPNAVLWVVSLAAGPGFALGIDGGLSLTGEMHGGALPAMPLLGALPGAGPLPGYALLLVAIPIGAGGVIGWFARPVGGTRGWREELATAAAAGAVCGLGVGFLAGYSRGGAGGRLEDFGPNGLLVGALLALQLAVAATVLAAGRIGWEHYGRRPKQPPVKATAMSPVKAPVTSPVKIAGKTSVIPAQKKPAAEPESTPIEVVTASDVDDLPTSGDPERLERAQEPRVETEDEPTN